MAKLSSRRSRNMGGRHSWTNCCGHDVPAPTRLQEDTSRDQVALASEYLAANSEIAAAFANASPRYAPAGNSSSGECHSGSEVAWDRRRNGRETDFLSCRTLSRS